MFLFRKKFGVKIFREPDDFWGRLSFLILLEPHAEGRKSHAADYFS